MNKNLLTIAGTAVVSLAVGAAGGYLYARKQLADVYQVVLEEEIERTKAYYRQKNQTGGFDTALDAAEALLSVDRDETLITVEDFRNLAKDLGYTKTDDPEEQNIFEGGEEEADDETIAREEAARSNEEPYIISVEEYMQSDTGYRQFVLTYFEGDDTLVDEQEKPVDETVKYVGDGNLRFGHRSKDRNVVYIRNDKADLEFEVIRSQRSYSEDVLGFVKPQNKIPLRMRRE